jgi:guanosine-3',5'-bis(diphosphate) 3'-pyrophosphohydrolase
VRVVLIKLADRLHNMRTLSYLSREKQLAMSKETLEIFAPLANRLGIWQMKWELEDLSFRFLNPEKYQELLNKVAEGRAEREQSMEHIKERISREMARYDIQAVISARPKHIYSIWRKMERKKVPFEEIYDVRAVRIIVPDKTACYLALGVIHNMWRPIAHEFDDYIASPKDNFYQSLHTAVHDEEGKTLEVQIRTPEMHEHAEYGIAAHWRYKEGSTRDEAYEKRIAYLRRLMEFSDDTRDAREFIEAMKADVFEDRVYAFTPRGDIMDLPAGATPIDFAYQVHSEVGNRCRGARVNGQIVPLDYRLKSGDRVEIITSKRGGPSLDWLNENFGYVRTNRARSKIRAYFRRLDRDKNVALGRDVVDRVLKQLGLEDKDLSRTELAAMFNFSDAENLYAAVGFGDITGGQITTKVLEAERKAAREAVQRAEPVNVPAEKGPLRAPVSANGGIDILGDNGTMLINLARCCNPAQGDEIIGFITRGSGVSVHRVDCPNILNVSEPERLIHVSWGKLKDATYPVPIVVRAYDREGLLRDVSAVVANEHVNIAQVSVETPRGVAVLFITLEIESTAQLARVLSRIEQLPNVIEARRRTSI